MPVFALETANIPADTDENNDAGSLTPSPKTAMLQVWRIQVGKTARASISASST